jgi:hypothetical protein
LDESVEKNPNANRPPEQLDQPGGSKQPKEADIHDPRCINNASNHRDEVKCVPGIFKVGLKIYEKSLRAIEKITNCNIY